MKLRVTMKTPGALDNAIYEAIDLEAQGCNGDDGEDPDDVDECIKGYADEIRQVCERWFRYRESVTLEIDSDAGTCVVIEDGLAERRG